MANARLRAQRKQAAWWNPMTGEATSRAGWRARPMADRKYLCAWRLTNHSSSCWPTARRHGCSRAASSARTAPGAAPAAMAIHVTGDWKVTFTPPTATFNKPRRNARPRPRPRRCSMSSLRSWTDDEATRYFSGTATYETQITLTEAFVRRQPGRGSPWASATGRLSTSRRPGPTPRRIRPRPCGSAPGSTPLCEKPRSSTSTTSARARCGRRRTRVDVTGLLVPGVNRLRVVVGNTAINLHGGAAAALLSAAEPSPRRTVHAAGHERFAAAAVGPAQPVTLTTASARLS